MNTIKMLSELASVKTQLEQHLLSYTHKQIELGGKIERLENTADIADKQLVQLEASVGQLEGRVQGLEAENKDLREESKELAEKVKKMEVQISDLEACYDPLMML